MEKLITVTKTATTTVAANLVRLKITVRGEGKSSGDAIEKCDTLGCSVVDALYDMIPVGGGSMNVAATRTDKKVTGYRAVRTLSAQFDYNGDLLASALDAISAFDVEWSVSFAASDAAARKELVISAVKAAREDAQAIADAAGVKLAALVKAEYSSDCGIAPVMLRAARIGNDLDPEDIALSETVTCSWEVEN